MGGSTGHSHLFINAEADFATMENLCFANCSRMEFYTDLINYYHSWLIILIEVARCECSVGSVGARHLGAAV